MNPRDEEIARYAAAVREATADVPEAERTELLEDLEDHLAEVAAESDEPLTVRLGPPEAYAAELRTAYGASSGKGRRTLRASAAANLDALERRLVAVLESNRAYAPIWAFILELRPAWWLVRGYLIALLIWMLMRGGDWHPRPWDVQELVIGAGLAVGSAALGVRARNRRGNRRLRDIHIAVSAGAVLGLLAIWFGPGISLGGGYAAPSAQAAVTYQDGGYPTDNGLAEVVNIVPYSRDGKPLKDVLLYDQDGRPIELPYEYHGYALNVPCGSPPPIANAYPLPLSTAEEEFDENGEPVPTCTPAPPTSSPTRSTSPSESPSPSPSPS